MKISYGEYINFVLLKSKSHVGYFFCLGFASRDLIGSKQLSIFFSKILIFTRLWEVMEYDILTPSRAVNGSDSNRIPEDLNANSLKIYKIYMRIRIQYNFENPNANSYLLL
jgi:hypothetical protein